VSKDRSRPGNRAFEFVLWGAVILVGGYVLLPAAVDLVRTRQQEGLEEAEATALEQKLREEQDRTDLWAKDPQAAEKKAELQAIEARKDNLQEESHD
jgi:flagellar biosynthesis/type III secretory pathway M-ring protein FliF/YscJ